MINQNVIKPFVLGLALGSTALFLSAGQSAIAGPINCEISVQCLAKFEVGDARAVCRGTARSGNSGASPHSTLFSAGILMETELIDMGAGPPLFFDGTIVDPFGGEGCNDTILISDGPVDPTGGFGGFDCDSPSIDYSCIGINQQ